MSTKKFTIAERVRNYRKKVKLSQAELGERLCVSGNYIYLIESGRKPPGGTLIKLFENMEQAPYVDSEASASGGRPAVPPHPIHAMFKTESLLKNFTELAEQLPSATAEKRKYLIGQLRDMLDELQSRELANSGPLSEAQQIAVKAASGRGAKRGA